MRGKKGAGGLAKGLDFREKSLHCEYMSRSLLPTEFAAFRRQLSARTKSGPPGFVTRHSPPSIRHGSRCRGGFTLVELLAVVLIIAILAGLGLATMGYVNRKAAESRAQVEVAALSAAIDSYKLEMGSYPAPENLLTELTGAGPVNTNKIYFEPTPRIVTDGEFTDPYGARYQYSTNPVRNIGFFDLWCVPPGATNAAGWIHN
jgi:general secretion pathway protein G